MALNFVYFDLETERLAEEVGGWSNIEQLGMAVGVTLHSRDDSFHVYRVNQTQELLADLRAADCVIGFNSRGFDFRVLQPYVDFNYAGNCLLFELCGFASTFARSASCYSGK